MEVILFLIIMGAIAWGVNMAPFVIDEWKRLIYIVVGIYSLLWVIGHLEIFPKVNFALH